MLWNEKNTEPKQQQIWLNILAPEEKSPLISDPLSFRFIYSFLMWAQNWNYLQSHRMNWSRSFLKKTNAIELFVHWQEHQLTIVFVYFVPSNSSALHNQLQCGRAPNIVIYELLHQFRVFSSLLANHKLSKNHFVCRHYTINPFNSVSFSRQYWLNTETVFNCGIKWF